MSGRGDLRRARTAARHQVSKQLLRHGHVYREGKKAWTKQHEAWLCRQRLHDPLAERALCHMRAHLEAIGAQLAAIEHELCRPSARQLTTGHCPAVSTRASQRDQLSLQSRRPPGSSIAAMTHRNDINPAAGLTAASISDEAMAGVGKDQDPVETIGRLGARLILQQALDDEVTEFLGRRPTSVSRRPSPTATATSRAL